MVAEDDEVLNLKETLCCIIDPFSLSVNEKRLLNRLYDYMKNEIQSSEFLVENNKVYSIIEQFAIHLIQAVDWNLDYTNKTDVVSLLKFMDIHFAEHFESLIEKIIEYVRIVYELLHVKCFIFVNILSYINEMEMNELFKFCQYQKINILLIENRQPLNIQSFKPAMIIDEDCCIIDISV